MSRRSKKRQRREGDEQKPQSPPKPVPASTPNSSKFKRLAFAVAAVLISTSLSLFVAEFAVRWSVEGGFLPALRSLTEDGVPVARTGKRHWVIPDPELGYRLNPDVAGPNPDALRNPSSVGPKQSGRRRLVVLGDSVSYVWGETAKYDEGWVHLLQTKLGATTEVINAAVPGYTTYQERRYFERDLARLQADLVLLQYCLNDNHRFLHQFDAEAEWLGTEEARRYLVPRGQDPLAWLPRSSYLLFRARLALLNWSERARGGEYPWENSYGFVPAWEDSSWQDFEQHLTAIQSAAEKAGGRPAVVIAPLAAQFNPEFLRRDARYVLKPQRKIATVCDSLGIPVLDLFRIMGRKGNFGLFEPDGIHFNAAGHRVAAEAVADWLSNGGP